MTKAKYFIGCDLLPKPSYSDAAIAARWAMYAAKEIKLKPGPSMMKVMENPDLPNNVFFMLHPSGRAEKVTFRWKDENKKEVIVERLK